MIEVEVKFRIENIREVEEKVADFAEFIVDKTESDVYFNSPWKDFNESDEALRIRKDDEGVTITYKGPKIDSMTKSREEVKVNIDDYQSGIQLLKGLGFTPFGEVVKNRRIYQLEGATFSVDRVEDLGEFLEIELQGDRSEVGEKTMQIFRLAQHLGFHEEQSIRRSYLELLKEKEE
ncbi:MAG: class IV adenylate cyclase [Archaeoglobaceae archaeon]